MSLGSGPEGTPGRVRHRIGQAVEATVGRSHQGEILAVLLADSQQLVVVEGAVTADDDLVEALVQQRDDPAEMLGGTFTSGRIARPVDQAEDLLGLTQRDRQRVIACMRPERPKRI